jgi:hypothetical protein
LGVGPGIIIGSFRENITVFEKQRRMHTEE